MNCKLEKSGVEQTIESNECVLNLNGVKKQYNSLSEANKTLLTYVVNQVMKGWSIISYER